jgi:hypothetical protein
LLRILERGDEVGERGVVDAAATLGRGDGEAHGQVRLPDARRPEEHDILASLDEAQRVEALELVAFDARLEAEVEVRERLHGRESRGPHGGLQPPLIAQRDVAAEERTHRLPGGELAAVGPAQDVVEGFEGAGHLEIGELGAQPIAERGRRHQPTSGRSWV